MQAHINDPSEHANRVHFTECKECKITQHPLVIEPRVYCTGFSKLCNAFFTITPGQFWPSLHLLTRIIDGFRPTFGIAYRMQNLAPRNSQLLRPYNGLPNLYSVKPFLHSVISSMSRPHKIRPKKWEIVSRWWLIIRRSGRHRQNKFLLFKHILILLIIWP